ncbi:MAG TPA: prepilin-type N-terminal cleavage/methylation domain-containing protein [Anaerolineaceae bacterium]|nr:prepilin-type N-terminal cleavage/methylation domain-containing protein [Anaerolineaceae bacterium]
MKTSSSTAGFSLLEVMIAMVLLVAAVYATNSVLTRVDKQQHFITDKLKARHLLDRRISDIITNAGFYPPMSKGGLPASYIACFNPQGFPMHNKLGVSDTFTEHLLDPSEPSDGCPGANFEVHVTPSLTTNPTAELYIFVKSEKPTEPVRQKIRMTVEMEPQL